MLGKIHRKMSCCGVYVLLKSKLFNAIIIVFVVVIVFFANMKKLLCNILFGIQLTFCV